MEELCTKSATLDQAPREASETESSVEHLAEEYNALHGDLQRQEAMGSQRDGVITKPRDEATPYGPPDGLLSDVEMPRLFQVRTLIFKFLM